MSKRVEVKIGCLGIAYSDVDAVVAELNGSSDEYYYSLKEYKEDEGDEEGASNITKKEKDIVGNNAPDIIMCGSAGIGQNFNLNQFGSKGIFMALDEFIEGDSEIDSEDLFSSLKDSCSYDGKMYTIIPSFVIRTMISKEEYFNQGRGMNFNEFEVFLDSHPNSNPFYNATRDEVFENFLAMGGNPFYSFSSEKCNFTSEEFKVFLEYLKDYPEEMIYDRDAYEYDELLANSYSNGDSLLLMCDMETPESIVRYEKLFFKDKVSAVGYPNDKGYSGYIVPATYTIGISKTTNNADAAWQFVRWFLLDNYQKGIESSIPASVKAFDYQATRLLKKDYVKGWFMYDYVNVGKLTEDDVNKFKDIILSSGEKNGCDSKVAQIVSEETQAFFLGEKKAEEVGKIIQSRASIYLKETGK